MAWAVVILTVVAVVVLVAVLVRQGAPWGLSEQAGTNRSQQQAIVEGRPAGPGAEAMGVDRAGEPTTDPVREEEVRERAERARQIRRSEQQQREEPAGPAEQAERATGRSPRPGQDDSTSS